MFIINNIEVIESQIRQIFAGTVWTHKIQEKQADIYLARNNKMENLRITLSAITTSGICAVVFIDKYSLKIITAIFSLVSLFVNSYFKVYDLKTLHKKHKKSALDLLELREELIAILCDIKLGKYDIDSLVIKRDEMIKKQISIYKDCLDASEEAVDKACEALKSKKDNTYSDEEIDSFLPVLARKIKNIKE
ncbi:SLATT domain-containing protein [Clostridium perfringens]|uniref:SLATT domain-containing protein n=1 Tax=Clostridium perfringens TaxID=1502 RepID=UPI001A2DC8A2|nr:SLATT domain-containing protein [Clostridium perfringens]